MFRSCVSKIFITLFFTLAFFPISSLNAQYIPIRTTTNSDGSQTTTINANGGTTVITNNPDGNSTIKKDDGTIVPYKTPVYDVPSNDTAPSTGLTLTPAAGGTYTLLAPIETFFPGGTVDVKGAGLGGYLNGLYRAGIAVATGLALIMIVVGGLEYVSTDSIQGKSNGRERIKNALIGLLLALTSFIILQQINPNLLKSDLQVESTGSTGSIDKVNIEFTEGISVASGPLLSQYPETEALVNGALQNSGIPGVTPTGGGTTVGGGVLTSSGIADRIVKSAKANISQSTCLIVTEGGKKGCGYAFGKIMSDAGITFSNLSKTQVLSTSNIYNVLKSDKRFYIVTSDILNAGLVISPIRMNLALPGDIIISPTVGSVTGHVGIVETAGAGKIISNSSGSASIESNYNGTSWIKRYRDKQKLNTYIFRYR